MGKLYELVKKEIEEIEKQATLEKSNLIKAKTFNNVNRDNKNMLMLNGLIELINMKAPELFGSREAFKEFLKDNDEHFAKKGPFKDDFVTIYGIYGGTEKNTTIFGETKNTPVVNII